MDTPIKGFLKFFSVRFDGSDFGNHDRDNATTTRPKSTRAKGNVGSAPNKKPLVLVGEKRRSKRRLSASGWASFQSTV
jgi:hypothetical protein